MADRQHLAPVILDDPESGGTRVLSPISGTEAPVDERTLQGLIAAHPELIPVDEMEPAFGPLVCLGQEVPTPAGPADVLYTSPQGYLTLVETKLWRNPQARREVVGQIVDYAKELANWSFDDLDSAVRQAIQPEGLAGNGILELLEAQDQLGDESQVIDTVTRNLQRGRLLLLIVGDGIRERVEAISSYLQDTPGLHFSLALLELALYQMEPGQEWPVLVQPRLVARTVEVVRAVVNVKAPPELEVEVELPETEEKSAKKGRRTLTESLFFEELGEEKGQTVADQVADLIDDLIDLGLHLEPRKSSVSMRVPDPSESGQEFTALVIRTSGRSNVVSASNIHKKGGYAPQVALQYLQGFSDITGATIGETQDSTEQVDVEVVLRKKDEFLALVCQFKSAIEAEAAGLD
jgi:hypothetical protein